MKPSEKEIRDQLDIALDSNKFKGMSYEDGVVYALEWVLGIRQSKPMDDDD